MQEPIGMFGGSYAPYSQQPVAFLKLVVSPLPGFSNKTRDENFDEDFRRRYAAILLRERGF